MQLQPQPSRALEGAPLKDRVLELMVRHKAEDIVVLDVSNCCSFTDFIVIASGISQTHVNALAQYVHRDLKGRLPPPLKIEGAQQNHWLILDLQDVVLHIFQPAFRQHYDLEKFWTMILEKPRKIS